MKGKKKIKPKSPEEIKFENELRKVKLQLEKGARIQSSGNVSPEIESLFLDQIETFDKAYKNAKPISVFEKIGKPEVKPLNKIKEKDLKKELHSLLKKMERKGISVDTICKVKDREFYRFITKELFKHKIENISIKGMMTHFTYEESHPNHEYDIKEILSRFINEILSGKKEIEKFYLAESFKSVSGKSLKDDLVLKKINLFQSFYSKFNIKHFEINWVNINERIDQAIVAFTLTFEATLDGTSEKQEFSGYGKSCLKTKFDNWMIFKFEMPGLSI